jgi:alpha-D-ribose 1-methylphosphonate 5-triphosphate synthase subunit PhnG
MAKIKIKELSRELKVSQEEMAKIRGGTKGIIIVNGRRLGPTGPDQAAFGSGGLTPAVVRLCM